jgi:predicted DNA-binding antitoxin AbrB/MazE fold protein
MTTIDAVYSGGVFTPVDKVDLPENQRVRIYVEPHSIVNLTEWLAAASEHRRNMEARHGLLPDSTEIIRADRNRDG